MLGENMFEPCRARHSLKEFARFDRQENLRRMQIEKTDRCGKSAPQVAIRFPKCFRISRVCDRAAVAPLDNAITGVYRDYARLLRRALSWRVRSKPDFGTHVDDASRFVFRESLLQSLNQGV